MSGGKLILDLSSDLTISSNIESDKNAGGGTGGGLEKKGDASLTLSGTNTYTGETTVSKGVLRGTTASIKGAITNNGSVIFDQASSGTYSEKMSGSGTLVKSGSGTLTLTGANTYTGGTTIFGGTLSVSEESNLGDAPGELIFNGGTLLATRSFISLRGVTMPGAGTIEVTGGPFTMSADISGPGALTKSGNGDLALTGINDYSGGTTVSAGVLEGTTTSLQGPINNNASVTFDQESSGTYSGIMSGSGTLAKDGSGKVTLSGANTYSGGTTVRDGNFEGTTTSLKGPINNNASVIFDQASSGTYSGVMYGSGSFTKRGSGTLTLSGANTYCGGTTVSTGVLKGTTTSLQGEINNNASVTFDQASSGTYSGAMSGSGILTKAGLGKVTLSGVNTLLGMTSIDQGILDVKGSLSSPVTVSSSAVLKGTGSVGTVQNNGTVSPGASIGTLTITGDYTQDASASLIVEIGDVSFLSDLLVVEGTANLNGSVALNPLPGLYEAGTVYTFLEANVINGTFSQLIKTNPLDFVINYFTNFAQIYIPFTGTILPRPIEGLKGLKGNAKKNCSLFIFSSSPLFEWSYRHSKAPYKSFSKRVFSSTPSARASTIWKPSSL